VLSAAGVAAGLACANVSAPNSRQAAVKANAIFCFINENLVLEIEGIIKISYVTGVFINGQGRL
jgi:hypothetical protein